MRVNRLIARLLLACVALFTFGVVNSGSALATLSCDDNVNPVTPGTTVNQSIVVPNGKTCILTHNTVVGSITIGSGATLVLTGSTVKGSILGTNILKLDVSSDQSNTFPSKINGSVTLNGETDQGFLCNTTLGGSFNLSGLSGGGYFDLGLTGPGQCDGSTSVGNTIGGSVNIHDNAGVADGNVYVYSNTVTGSVNVQNNGSGVGFIRIHDNIFKSSLNALGNHGGGEIVTNTINGSVACGNTPTWEFTGNTVKGATTGLTAGRC